MNKMVYPVILSKGKQKAYTVHAPDFPLDTQGDSLANALDMVKDAIEMMGVCLQDNNEPLPKPSDIEALDVKEGQIKSLVTVDFDAYRRSTETRTIKKNLTLPSWLNVEAEAAGINFSATLQEALKERLGL